MPVYRVTVQRTITRTVTEEVIVAARSKTVAREIAVGAASEDSADHVVVKTPWRLRTLQPMSDVEIGDSVCAIGKARVLREGAK